MTMVVRSCIRKAQKRLYTKNEKVQCAKNLYQPSMCFFSRWWLSRKRIKMFVHIYQINEIVEKIRLWILIQEMKVWISNKNDFFLTITIFIEQSIFHSHQINNKSSRFHIHFSIISKQQRHISCFFSVRSTKVNEHMEWLLQ